MKAIGIIFYVILVVLLIYAIVACCLEMRRHNSAVGVCDCAGMMVNNFIPIFEKDLLLKLAR